MLSGESFLPLLPGFLTFWVLGWDTALLGQGLS